MTEPILLAVFGPTAVGKTDLAEDLADRYNAKLINCDAFQVYRGLDIGTAKPVRKQDYALVDIKDPASNFGVGEWVVDAAKEINQNFEQGQSSIVVGGTGLYIRALFQGYTEMLPQPDPVLRQELMDREAQEGLPKLAQELEARAPEVAEKTDLKNPARVRRALERLSLTPIPIEFKLPPVKSLKIGLDIPKPDLDERISARILRMVQNGWIKEIEGLRDAGYRPEQPGFRALGYRSMWQVLEGEIGLEDAIATTIAETCRYAKRQRTWLRSEPRLAVIDLDSHRSDPFGDALRRAQTYIETKE